VRLQRHAGAVGYCAEERLTVNRSRYVRAHLFFLLLMISVPAAWSEDIHPVRISIFVSKDCPACAVIGKKNIADLARKLGCSIEPRYISIDEEENYDLLIRLEQQHNDEGNEVPVVFIGRHVLGGVKEVEARFEQLVGQYAKSGGAQSYPELKSAGPLAHQAPAVAGAKPIYIAYFDSPGCKQCRRMQFMLQRLRRDYPTIQARTFLATDRESQILQEAMFASLNVPQDRRLLTPAFIVGNRPFIREEITDRKLREYLASVVAVGTKCPWSESYDLAAAEKRLRAQLRALGAGAVVVGGLIDGINPCAFATLILFISYMGSAGRERRKLMAIGLSFIAAVFLVYLAVGLGLMEVVALADRIPYLDAVITWGIVALCVVLAIYSLSDAIKAARGKHREITLQLPAGVKGRIRSILIRFRKTRYLILGGLLIGGLISLLELVCTGQIYLPLIKVMVSTGGPDRTRALSLLLLYNLCFVIPLLVIFLSACWGVTSQRLGVILRKHMAVTKVVTSLFFLVLAALMVGSKYYWQV